SFPTRRSSDLTTEVAPTLTGSLEICGLRGDARRPRRIEVVRRIEHRVRVHRHPMLAGHGLEERADGVFPAASRHPRPLFSHGAEVFEQATLARLDLDLVRVSDLQTADGGLEAPAPDVVRVRVPDDADRRAHGVSPRLSTGLLSSPGFGWSESLWAWIRVADLCASTTVSGRACSCSSGSVSSRSSASPYPRPCIPKPSVSSTKSSPSGRSSSSGSPRSSRRGSSDPRSDISPSFWESSRWSRSGCSSRTRTSDSGPAGWNG